MRSIPASFRRRGLTALAALLVPLHAAASVSLNCLGSSQDRTAVQVHAVMDCAFDDGSIDWCDFAVKIDEDWIDLPNTLRSVKSARFFPEVPDDLADTKVLRPPVIALKVLEGKTRTVLLLVLDKIVVNENGPVLKGRATLDWKGHRFKDVPVTCDDPG